MAAQLFSVGDWLRASGYSKYEPEFLKHGYASYDAIVKLTRDDLRAAGVPGHLTSEVDDLKAVSEDEAIRILSVSVLVYAWLIIVCLYSGDPEL